MTSLAGALSGAAASITSAGVKKVATWIGLQLAGTAALALFLKWFKRVSGVQLPAGDKGWEDAFVDWALKNPEQNLALALGQLEAMKKGILPALAANPGLVAQIGGDAPEGSVLANAAALARNLSQRSGDGSSDTIYDMNAGEFNTSNTWALEEYKMVRRMVQIYGSLQAAQDAFNAHKVLEEGAFKRYADLSNAMRGED